MDYRPSRDTYCSAQAFGLTKEAFSQFSSW